MKRVYGVFAAWLMLAAIVAGQAPPTPIPLDIKGDIITVVKHLPFTVTAPAGSDLYFWSVPAGVVFTDKGNAIDVTTAPGGTITIGLKTISVDWESKKLSQKFGSITFVVGDVPPPVPPPPPPDPTPPPSPAPIPAAGFRVLIVYESGDLSKMPPAQQQILFSKQMRDYLNTKCVAGPDGKTREFRIYDKDVDVAAESPIWQAAMKRPRTATPWIVISNGTSGFEGPLPATVADAMTLLEKYAPK